MWLPDVAMLSVGASQDLCLDVQRPPLPAPLHGCKA